MAFCPYAVSVMEIARGNQGLGVLGGVNARRSGEHLGVLVGKPTELCRGRNQLGRKEGLSLPESADSQEQTLEQFPRGDTNASCTESLPSAKRAANSRWVDQAWRREL